MANCDDTGVTITKPKKPKKDEPQPLDAPPQGPPPPPPPSNDEPIP